MRKITLLFIVFTSLQLPAQNEFAATAFYKEFNKIYEDAQKGFVTNKGSKLLKDDFATTYHSKLLLSLADSGKIFFPNEGNPYVEYYFEPKKRKEDIDKTAADLVQAITIAYNKPLYSETRTVTVKNNLYSNTFIYDQAPDVEGRNLVFKCSIYKSGKNYMLAFRIMGKPMPG
jgi:hypothetical protein